MLVAIRGVNDLVNVMAKLDIYINYKLLRLFSAAATPAPSVYMYPSFFKARSKASKKRTTFL